MSRPKSYTEPDFSESRWPSEDSWDGDVDKMLEEVKSSPETDPYSTEEGLYILHVEKNCRGPEDDRYIGLEHGEQDIYSTHGILDSKPGCTNQYTRWDHYFSPEELETEISMLEDEEIVENAELLDVDQEEFKSLFQYQDADTADPLSLFDNIVGKLPVSGLFQS